MKIRSDYVSNSSSSSFIIDFEDKGACIDEGFMKLLKHINGIILRCHCASKEQLKEFEEKAKTVFGPKVDLWTYEDDLDFEVSVNSEHIMAEDCYGQMNFIRLILQNAVAQVHALVADIQPRRSGNQAENHVCPFSAEAAVRRRVSRIVAGHVSPFSLRSFWADRFRR